MSINDTRPRIYTRTVFHGPTRFKSRRFPFRCFHLSHPRAHTHTRANRRPSLDARNPIVQYLSRRPIVKKYRNFLGAVGIARNRPVKVVGVGGAERSVVTVFFCRTRARNDRHRRTQGPLGMGSNGTTGITVARANDLQYSRDPDDVNGQY